MNYSALFRNYLLNLGTSNVTVKNYTADVNHFVRWLKTINGIGEFDLRDITPELIQLYRKESLGKFSPSSIERHISSLRKFFKFLKLNGSISQSPFEAMPNSYSQNSDLYRIKDFKNYLYVSNASNITIKNYINDTKQFIKWAQEVTKSPNSWVIESNNVFKKLDNSLLFEYKNRLILNRFSPRSINRKLSSLRKYLNWALESGVIEKKAWEGLSNLTKPPSLKIETKIKNEAKKNKVYSNFPPVRLLQKCVDLQNLLVDTFIALPLAYLIKGFEQLIWKSKGKPVFIGSVRKIKAIRNLPKEFYAPHSVSLAYLPFHRKLIHHLKYSRPEWYKRYHTYSITHYLHLAILFLVMSAIGFAIYDSVSVKSTPTEAQVLAALNNPPRLFSFQGRLTDANDTPITATTNLRFALYENPTASGGALKWQEVQTVTPDSDGTFSVLLGKKTALSQSIFTIHSGLWLGITVGTTAELTPRQQLASVAFAQNSDLLQGLRPITETGAPTSNVILALDSNGDLIIGGTATPTFQATGGRFTVSGNVLRLTTLAGSNSNIELRPDGTGKIDLQEPLQNTSNNNNVTSARGAVEVNDLFAILATSSGQSAFTVDQNSGGPIISASASGVQRFTVDNSGNTTISGNFLPTLTASKDLGASNLRWNNIWVQTINAAGTNTSGQASFTYDPLDTTYAQSTVLINPTSAGANESLLGLGVGGVEKARIDIEGDFLNVGNITTTGGIIESLTQFRSGSGNDLRLNANGANRDIFLQVNGTTLATVQGSTTNLGIGTTGPIGKLNIESADSGVTTASGASDELVIEGSGNSGISILTPNTANAQISFGDPQDNNVGNINYIHSENRMQFRTAGLNTGLDIDSSGEVGIGTTTPGEELEVSALDDAEIVALIRGSNSGTSVGIYKQLAILNQHTGVNTQTGLSLQHYNASSVAKDAAVINASLSNVTAGSETGYLTLSTISSGSLAERLRVDSGRIDATGSIYIRDTGCNCQVLNFANSSGTSQSSILNVGGISNGIRFAPGNNNRMTIFPGGELFVGEDDGGVTPADKLVLKGDARVGTGTTGCVKDADGTVIAGTCSSDVRLKKNIESIGFALSKVVKLNPVYFNWRSSEFPQFAFGTEKQTGLIAQEVEKILPELVTTDDKGYKQIRFSYLTFFLIQAIKDINKKVDNLANTSCIQSSSSEDFGLIKSVCSESTIQKLTNSGTYIVKNYLGEVATGGQILAEAVVGILRVGYIEAQEIVAGRIETNKLVSPVAEIATVKTDTITPLSSDKVVVKLDTSVNSASQSSKPSFEIQNASGSAVAVIDDHGNASLSGTLNSFGLVSKEASIAGTLTAKNIVAENIQTEVAGIRNLISTLTSQTASESGSFADIASYSAQLAYVDTLNAEVGTFMQGLFAVGPSSLSDATVFGQLAIGANLILADNSINVLGSDLQIQPLGQGGVDFLAGKITIDANGNLNVSGNATIKGTIFANSLSPIPGAEVIEVKDASGSAVASINTKGEATFRKLNLSLIKPAFALSETELIATGSAGIATISANFKEVTIQNEVITDKSLIYISPVGTPSANTPFLLRVTPKDELLGNKSSFTVGVQDLLELPLPFNWLIIN